MEDATFTTTILVDKTPKEAFDAINNVRGWWTGGAIEGETKKLNDEFTYRHPPYHYSKQKLIEVVPGKKVVWLITDSQLDFIEDKDEWTGTKIVFDISSQGEQTQVRFTHQGLVPGFQCYSACSNAWTGYVREKLREFIMK